MTDVAPTEPEKHLATITINIARLRRPRIKLPAVSGFKTLLTLRDFCNDLPHTHLLTALSYSISIPPLTSIVSPIR
jgi:hypothetical protein